MKALLLIFTFLSLSFAEAHRFEIGETVIAGPNYFTVVGFYENGMMAIKTMSGQAWPDAENPAGFAKTSGCIREDVCVGTKVLAGPNRYIITGFYPDGTFSMKSESGVPWPRNEDIKGFVILGQKSESTLLPLDQVNKLLQPSEGLMVILGEDLRIPKGAGYGAVKENSPVQCWVGQTEKSNNAIRYKSQRTLKIGTVKMADSRKDIRLQILDDEDLNEISCTSTGPINIKVEADLGKILEASGLTLQEPPEIVKEKK